MLVPITLVNMATLFVDGLVFFAGGILAYGVMGWLGSLIAARRAQP